MTNIDQIEGWDPRPYLTRQTDDVSAREASSGSSRPHVADRNLWEDARWYDDIYSVYTCDAAQAQEKREDILNPPTPPAEGDGEGRREASEDAGPPPPPEPTPTPRPHGEDLKRAHLNPSPIWRGLGGRLCGSDQFQDRLPAAADVDLVSSQTPQSSIGKCATLIESTSGGAERCRGKCATSDSSSGKCATSADGSEEKCSTPSGGRRGKCSTSSTWSPRHSLARITCARKTRDAIFDYVPAAEDDDILFRYVVYAQWSTWTDDQSGQRVISEEVMHWIGHHRFDTAIAVIRYIEDRIDNFRWIKEIPNRRCRLIAGDGLPPGLWRVVRNDLTTDPSEYENRVYVLSGEAYHKDKHAPKDRAEIREELEDVRHNAPSLGAQKTWELLNDRPSNLFSKLSAHIAEAIEYVERMDIGVSPSKDEDTSWEAWRKKKRKMERQQRDEYLRTLRTIADQHQPFYKFSRAGRTDRVFSYNKSALNLPSSVRKILCQDFVEVDLKSAHLLIAAWLWDAEEALEKLVDEDYSIWDDLMAHCAPLFREQDMEVPEKGEELYATVKSAMKIAVYSTVYGMPAPSIQAKLTKALKDILGPGVGAHIRLHPIIKALLEKRDEKLAEMKVGDVLHGPTGIRIEIEQPMSSAEDGVDAKSALATLAQSYEQACMQVILEMEREREESDTRNYFKTVLWLHDGAYVKMRSQRARMKDLTRRLDERCKELADFAGKDTPLPAFFEVEEITPTNPEDTQQCKNENQKTSSSTSSTPATPKSKTQKRETPSAAPAESRSEAMSTSTAGASATSAASTSPDVPHRWGQAKEQGYTWTQWQQAMADCSSGTKHPAQMMDEPEEDDPPPPWFVGRHGRYAFLDAQIVESVRQIQGTSETHWYDREWIGSYTHNGQEMYRVPGGEWALYEVELEDGCVYVRAQHGEIEVITRREASSLAGRMDTLIANRSRRERVESEAQIDGVGVDDVYSVAVAGVAWSRVRRT